VIEVVLGLLRRVVVYAETPSLTCQAEIQGPSQIGDQLGRPTFALRILKTREKSDVREALAVVLSKATGGGLELGAKSQDDRPRLSTERLVFVDERGANERDRDRGGPLSWAGDDRYDCLDSSAAFGSQNSLRRLASMRRVHLRRKATHCPLSRFLFRSAGRSANA